ncbi:MAG: SpoIIE family protein phosphatase [Bacilli bacterium]|nr:SpoIIE family protein phosphatase [Bacilli bacterium]
MKKRKISLSITILLPVLLGVLATQTAALLASYYSIRKADFDDAVAVDQTQLVATLWSMPSTTAAACNDIKAVYEAHPIDAMPTDREGLNAYRSLYNDAINGANYQDFSTNFPSGLLGDYADYLSVGFFDAARNRFVTVLNHASGSIYNPSFPGSFDTLVIENMKGASFYGQTWHDEVRNTDYMISGTAKSIQDPMGSWWIIRHTSLATVYNESQDFMSSFIWVTVATFSAMVVFSFLGIHFGLLRPIRRLSKTSDAYVQAMEGGHLTDSFKLDPKRHTNELTTLNDSLYYMQGAMKEYASEVAGAAAREQKRAADMALAEKIQGSMVPQSSLIDQGVSFFGKMHPAREVGGDFFSYFRIDGHHMGFYIADVSGKGIPAALFMARAASVARLLLGGLDIEAINNTLAQENTEDLFVTGFFGLVDTEKKELHYVNCGHEPVYLRHQGVYTELEEAPNLPLGCLEDFAFKKQSIALEEGDALFLYTDGLSEAMNPQGELFGKEAILSTLNENPLLSGEDLFAAMDEKVAAFVNGAEQSDDTCLLHFEMASQAVCPFEPTMEGLAKMTDFVEETLSPHFDLSVIAPLNVVLDEFASNVVKFSGATKACLHLSYGKKEVRVILSDDGVPFDPVTAKIEKQEDQPGGLGILLATHMSSALRYTRAEGKNFLSFSISKKD